MKRQLSACEDGYNVCDADYNVCPDPNAQQTKRQKLLESDGKFNVVKSI